ncbi:xanthine permease [Bacillus sp. DTU_2020_1000418_1_SI_GHA_SEK_038]|uniref:xanthine permease n=1 Tax=Bacillus sp. DTU_2020_1000418_1_SI_GHA_SEK_038 TaxID=3077585 RepID=UPI0028F03365|nr:xanthine permease [Bacillus sp. DTU_2020_1000418_1_SI_GHA_SEK_038]WNS74750.1 xanthine permease [Bacillus sp. DTU_2020_1000418_1_SI_GHA_SEK_038]
MGKVAFWKKGDIAAAFGLFVNVLTDFLVMISLLIGVVGMPSEFVFKRIVPGFGLAVLISGIIFAYFAYQLAKKTGRTDVTALPSGSSSPGIFLIVFVIMLPLYHQTQDAVFTTTVAVIWGFVEASILFLGAFLGETIRKIVPRTVLLAALAGLAFVFLGMNPMLQSFEMPIVAFVALIIIFMNWLSKHPIFKRIPTGLLLIVVGTAIAWIAGYQNPADVTAALKTFGFNPPMLHLNGLVEHFSAALPYLLTAIPLGLANYIFNLENVEAAAVSGDEYKTRDVMLANGFATAIGGLCGNPFPVTVYVGHAGWKEVGAGLGYSIASSAAIFLLSIFSLMGLLLAVVPIAAIVPMLVFIAIVTGHQVVKESPAFEAPAIFVCFFPWVANWALVAVNNALSAAGTSAGNAAGQVSSLDMNNAGLFYDGLVALGNGAPISSVLWGCIAVFTIRNTPIGGIIAAVLAAGLSFMGAIHTATIGFAQATAMPFVWGYLLIALFLAYKLYVNKKENIGPVTE